MAKDLLGDPVRPAWTFAHCRSAQFDGAFDGDLCARATIAWSPDGTTVAYRAMLHGTPGEISRDPPGDRWLDRTEVVQLDGATFDIGEGPCCLAWLPAA